MSAVTFAPDAALVVKHFPPEWLVAWTPQHQVAFHIPTGQILRLPDDRCPIIVLDWAARCPEAQPLEALSESDKDVAIAQAVVLAEYVVSAARGSMVERAQRFLSLRYSQEIAARLRQADELHGALEALFASYKMHADSGDGGNWRVEDMDEGKRAMRALAEWPR